MNWKSIRLELAHTADHPEGSVSRAFLIRVPLDTSGRIDGEALARTPDRATVRRYWMSDPDQTGLIQRDHGHWVLNVHNGSRRQYRYELDDSPLAPDQPVKVNGPDGAAMEFRVVRMWDWGEMQPAA